LRKELYKIAQLCEAVYLKTEKQRTWRFTQLGYDCIGWFDNNGTQAALLRSGEVLTLCFRGTESVKDWLTDLDVRKTITRFGYVHNGFNQGVDNIWKEFLLSHQGDGTRNKYVVVGHSLGAAEAVIAAARLSAYENVDVIGVYLFGCPRVGGYSFKYPKVPTYRVVNNNDVVCRVPSVFRFKHIGTRYYIDKDGDLIKGITPWQITKDRLSGRWQSKNIVDGLFDHPISEYIKQLS
jgi:predicted lipase